jgi:hypothetical protein
MKRIQVLLLTGVASALFAFAPLAANAAPQSEKNDKLLKATDPFEGLTESALSGDSGKIAKATPEAVSFAAPGMTLGVRGTSFVIDAGQ